MMDSGIYIAVFYLPADKAIKVGKLGKIRFCAGFYLIPGGRELECEIAKELGNIFELTVPYFGASDCRCGGHLFYSQEYL